MQQEFLDNLGIIGFFLSFITASLAIVISMNSHYRTENNLAPTKYRMLSWLFGIACVPSTLLIPFHAYTGSLFFLDVLMICGVGYFYGRYLKKIQAKNS